MRGLAATAVATAHALAAFHPAAVFGESNRYAANNSWEVLLNYPPLSVLTAGHFAVCLFFVLSGYVLSYRFIGQAHQTIPLLSAIVKRPLRLAGVLLFSLFCAGLLLQFNFLEHSSVASARGSGPWLNGFWTEAFSWSQLAFDIAKGSAGAEYNPPLWTLKIELIGSFLVFGLLFVLNRFPYAARLAILLLMLVVTYGSYYDGFIWGMLLADASKFKSHKLPILPAKTKWLVCTLVLLLSAYPYYYVKETVIQLPGSGGFAGLLTAVNHHIPMVSAVVVLIMVKISVPVQNLLSHPVLVWLGEQSYALYAIHFLLLASLCSHVFMWVTPLLGAESAVLAAMLSYLVTLPLLAWLTTRLIDLPTIKLANRLGRQSGELLNQVLPKQIKRAV